MIIPKYPAELLGQLQKAKNVLGNYLHMSITQQKTIKQKHS